MACVLLVDPREVAQRAMKGILARGGHRLAIVEDADAATRFVRSTIRVDLVFTELQLTGEGGLEFIQRLKSDFFLKYLPVVIYAEQCRREAVKRGLDLRVQNFLLKPYVDEAIFREIAKASANPWRNRLFHEEESFCRLHGLTPAALHRQLEQLRTSLAQARLALGDPEARRASPALVPETLARLTAEADAAGAWGIVDCVRGLEEKAAAGAWLEFEQVLDGFTLADALIFQHLNPTLLPEAFLASHELSAGREALEHTRWFNAPDENRCPVVTPEMLQREIDGLRGCPVIDTVAASFEMGANGHRSSLGPLMDVVDKDPALAAQVLISASAVCRDEDPDANAIEDPRLSISLLGEQRLASLARGLEKGEERLMHLPPAFTWPQYWAFQVGVARIARFTARYLELNVLEAPAYTAGLLHDIGKLILLRLHPFALQATLEYARRSKLPLAEAEKKFFGCTTADLAVHFATRHRLPPRFAHVMRWVAAPHEAEADAELVAIVSFARKLCQQNRVGVSGDTLVGRALPLEETPEWRVLRDSVFPSFNLREFEQKVQTFCREMRLELHGRIKEYAAA